MAVIEVRSNTVGATVKTVAAKVVVVLRVEKAF